MLCTGRLSEANNVIDDVGEGIVGPHNAVQGLSPNPGELSWDITGSGADDDFATAVPLVAPKEDPVALEFQVKTTQPGFFLVTFAFASDEYPYFITAPFNDTPAVLIKSPDPSPQDPVFKNILLFRKRDTSGIVQVAPFTLQDFALCESIFLTNDTGPAPTSKTRRS